MAHVAKDLQDPKEIESTIVEFEKKLDRLRTLYEQYFMGIEKREPAVALKDVVRVMRILDGTQIRNTGLRFRFRTLVQRFNVYRTYWNRTLRAIDAGTYQRDLAKLQRSMARKGVEMPKVGTLRNVAEIERAMTDAARELSQPKPTDDTDKHPALTDHPIEEPLAAAPAASSRRRVAEPEPLLGPIDLDDNLDLDDDAEEQTGKRERPEVPARVAPAARPSPPRPSPQRTPSSPDLDEMIDLEEPAPSRTRSSPGAGPAPEAASQRTRSSPDAGRAPEAASQRTRSSPDVGRRTEEDLPAPPRTPSSPGLGRATGPDLPALTRTRSSPDVGRAPEGTSPRARSSPDVGRAPEGTSPRTRSSPDVGAAQRTGSGPRPAPGGSQPGRTASGVSRPQARAARAPAAGPSEDEIQSLYRRFVKAKKLCGEDTSSVHIESLRKSIDHQLPKIREMYKGREVEFQVVIRSGRAILKAKPKD